MCILMRFFLKSYSIRWFCFIAIIKENSCSMINFIYEFYTKHMKIEKGNKE